jgi:ferredoxin
MRRLTGPTLRTTETETGSNFAEYSARKTLHVLLDGSIDSLDYHVGDTILEAARRGRMCPPFRCQSGNCGTCRALVETGTAQMRRNNYFTALSVKDGWVLTCQATPTRRELFVNYDARPLVPGLRFLLRTTGLSRISRMMSHAKQNYGSRYS